jgi:hypothetical protein
MNMTPKAARPIIPPKKAKTFAIRTAITDMPRQIPNKAAY